MEYLIYASLSKNTQNVGQCGYNCALYYVFPNGEEDPVGGSEADFDVGVFLETSFEGHECKINAWNFLFYHNRLKSEGRRKLQFMDTTCNNIRNDGLECAVYITGLYEHPDRIEKRLKESGFGNVGVLGPDDIEDLLTA